MITNYAYRYTMHTPVSRRDITGNPSSPVKTYTLPPEELERYRNMPPPKVYKQVDTTARQYLRAMR